MREVAPGDRAARDGHTLPLDAVELTIEGAQNLLLSGQISAEVLVQAFLGRIATYNPGYNALIFINPHALCDARTIDRRRAAGEPLGPLAGIPVVVKDTMDWRGFPTTAGWSLLHGGSGGVELMPCRDSTVVARLKAAGAVLLGKTNVPVLSHSGSHANDSWAGPTYNAAGRQFVPGGSSAGTATAVAASMAVLGLAEETGGSIQNPAAAQGLVGVKPTHGLVPMAGVMPLSGLRDVVGPIARCVRDAALCLDAIAGGTAEDPNSDTGMGRTPRSSYATKLHPESLRGARLGTYGPGWRNQPLSVETAQLYGRARQELEQLGAVWVHDPFAGSGFADLRKPTLPLGAYDDRGLESLPSDLQKYLERLGPAAALKSFAEFAAATSAQDPFKPSGVLHSVSHLPGFAACMADPARPPEQAGFRAARASYLRIFAAVVERHRLDALVFPQMRDELPRLHGVETIHETTVDEINIAGLPGVTVPAGYYRSGAPFSLIVVGPRWSEADLLAYAYDYESATRYRRAPVLVGASGAPS